MGIRGNWLDVEIGGYFFYRELMIFHDNSRDNLIYQVFFTAKHKQYF